MEVASNSSTILLQTKHVPRIPPLPQRRSAPLMVATSERRTSDENSNTNSPGLKIDINVPSSSASEATEPSPALLSLTPPPEGEQGKEPSGISPALNGSTHSSQSKKIRRSHGFDEGSRKSRITRNRDDPSEVVNNYVDSKEIKKSTPRMIPPKGGRRIPFQLPKMELEKEKDKLKINMVGPKTKAPADFSDLIMKPRRSNVCQIGVGADFQAEFDYFHAEDFIEPPQTSRAEIPDRDDQLMWMDDRTKLKDKERELDDAWTAIRRQFNGKIGIDAMLHRLMLCNYDIDEMLINIELELFEELPQPFEELNEAQQAEFERILSKNGGYQNGKAFRTFQEKFLKGYYMGEIIQYYYETKHRGCTHVLNHRCECRDKWIRDFSVTPRYECYNCTKYIWGTTERSHRGQTYCSICELYNNRNRRHRVPAANLTEPDEKLATAWKTLEGKKGQPVNRNEFAQHLEEVRKENMNVKAVAEEVPAQMLRGKIVKQSAESLFELTKKFKVKTDSRCSSVRPWGKEARTQILQKYTSQEKTDMVKAFHKHGLRTDMVANEVGKTEREVWTFYYLFNDQYLLDKVIIPQKKILWMPQHMSAINTAENSNSPTPEPMNRRKRTSNCHQNLLSRGGSSDPSFERREAPPPKSTRRTRQSAAAEHQAELDLAHADD